MIFRRPFMPFALWLCWLFSAGYQSVVFADDPKSKEATAPKIDWIDGPVTARLGDIAQVKIPEGYRFCNPNGVHLRIPWRQGLDRPRVLLAEVSRAMLATEIALLSPEFDVVGTAADGAALVSEACRVYPDVIVTIFDMPILSGIDAMRKLQTSDCTARFIFFTLHLEREFLECRF